MLLDFVLPDEGHLGHDGEDGLPGGPGERDLAAVDGAGAEAYKSLPAGAYGDEWEACGLNLSRVASTKRSQRRKG